MTTYSRVLVLENPMDRGARWTTVCGVAESDMTEQACTHQASSAILDRAGISSSQKVLLSSAPFRAIWALEDDC